MGSTGITRRYPSSTRASIEAGYFPLSAWYWSMRSRKRKRFSRSTASFDWMTDALYCGSAIAARIAMRATTVMSSMSVNPSSSSAAPALPVTVLRPVEGRALALGEDVVDVRPAPGRAVGLVLVAPHPPLRALGQGIHGDAAEELQLLVERAHAAHALDQDLEVGRVAFAPEL